MLLCISSVNELPTDKKEYINFNSFKIYLHNLIDSQLIFF